MSVLVLDAAVPSQRQQWLDLWRAWPQRDIVAHPGFAELFVRAEYRAVCVAHSGPRGGILFPLLVRPLNMEPWVDGTVDACDLVSPYGYGGPFGWGINNVEAFWHGFSHWASSIRAVSLFTRFSLFKETLIPFYGDTVTKGPCVIVSLNKDADALMASYHEKIRENIRQAQRAGVTIETDRTCRRLDELLSAYYSTMDRHGALPMYYFPREFFSQLMRNLKEQVVLFHAVRDGRVISSEMVLVSEQYLYPFVNGTTFEGRQVRANPLLRHAINLWGKEQGMEHVVLGGGYSGEDGLLQYKQRFAPYSHVPFCVGTHVLDRSLYDGLVEQRASWARRHGTEWSPSQDFFPAYRG